MTNERKRKAAFGAMENVFMGGSNAKGNIESYHGGASRHVATVH
jgi:hypothetical protein